MTQTPTSREHPRGVPIGGRPIRLAQLVWRRNDWRKVPIGPHLIAAMERWDVAIRVFDYYRVPQHIREILGQTPATYDFDANVVADLRHATPHYIVVYNGRRRRERIWWSLAHEFGHVLLGHVFTQGWHDDPQKEREADMFAAELLLPLGALKEVRRWPLEHIARGFDTSLEATRNRLKDLANGWIRYYTVSEIEEGRKRFLQALRPMTRIQEDTMAPLDNTPPYIQVDWDDRGQVVRLGQCPQCTFENTSLYAHLEIRCGQCGAWLINTCQNMECRLHGLPLPESYQYCGRCGTETSWVQSGSKNRPDDDQELPDDLTF